MAQTAVGVQVAQTAGWVQVAVGLRTAVWVQMAVRAQTAQTAAGVQMALGMQVA